MPSIEKLLEVMMRLRDPRDGCPWDRAQTFDSIAAYTLEEAYEVADAIARNDMRALCDELGDLLFQVVFHSRLAEEAGFFDFDAVAAGIAAKMVRRHPHVFGCADIRSADPDHGSWERIKADERGDSDGSAMAGVTQALPALRRAQKLGRRAAAQGFDWDSRAGVREKIREELEELEAAAGLRETAGIRDEFGDLLFAVVNLGRHLEVDAEQALAAANAKFERRFREMERQLAAAGKSVRDLNHESLDQAWRAAKRAVG